MIELELYFNRITNINNLYTSTRSYALNNFNFRFRVHFSKLGSQLVADRGIAAHRGMPKNFSESVRKTLLCRAEQFVGA